MNRIRTSEQKGSENLRALVITSKQESKLGSKEQEEWMGGKGRHLGLIQDKDKPMEMRITTRKDSW